MCSVKLLSPSHQGSEEAEHVCFAALMKCLLEPKHGEERLGAGSEGGHVSLLLVLGAMKPVALASSRGLILHHNILARQSSVLALVPFSSYNSSDFPVALPKCCQYLTLGLSFPCDSSVTFKP